MLKKQRKIPLIILKLEALLRRLPSHHPWRAKIDEDLAKFKAGYRGEQALDYYLDTLPKNDFYIFHDIRLPYKKDKFFQLDTLIVTPWYIIILEVKNISGTLYFDQSFNQLLRTLNGKEEAFPDPILQIKRQKIKFEGWLKKQIFSTIPILFYVVISNPSTLIKAKSESIKNIVIHAGAIPDRFESVRSRFKDEKLTKKEMNRMSRLLIKHHSHAENNVLAQYKIQKSELIKGVQCPGCRKFAMERVIGAWFCTYCRIRSNHAHVSALNDYRLLINDEITNREIRDFLLFTSRQTATRLLTSQTATQTGNQKNRKYILQLPD